jgi:hypothetical protein
MSLKNNKQTSVDWIYNELVVFMTGNSDFESAEELFRHGKEMHKEEIKSAFDYGMNCSADYFEAWSKTTEAENYYNETFNK